MLALAGFSLLAPLSACGSDSAQDKAEPTTDEPGRASLAATFSDAPGLTTFSEALKSTGLTTVFDGTAPYTLLAPDDKAFGALDQAGKTLQAPENSAALATVLRDHILPGYLTVDDIDSALRASGGRPVTVKTMGGTEVSFVREGEALVVSTAEGARARVSGSPLSARNGAVIPIDAVLRKLPSGDGAT